MLELIGDQLLLCVHGRDIAHLLFSLVRDKGKPFALEILNQANTSALACWNSLVP